MKIKLSILIGPLLLWACSADPKKQGLGNLGSQSQQAADATRENEGIIVDSANSGEVATTQGGLDTPADPQTASDAKPSDSKMDSPPVASGPAAPKGEDEESGITPPHKITGAFLVGEVIEDEEESEIPAKTVKIGIVARHGEDRLSQQPDRYALNWLLSVDVSLESYLRLLPTKNAAYDRVLEFDGSMEELESFGENFSINLLISEESGPTNLESVVKSNLDDLFAPIPAE